MIDLDQAAETMFGETTAPQPAPTAPQPRPAPRQPVSLAMTPGERIDRTQRTIASGRESLTGDDFYTRAVAEAEQAGRVPPPPPPGYYAHKPPADTTPEVRQPATVPHIVNLLTVPAEVQRHREATATIEDRMFAGTPVDLGSNADAPLTHDFPTATEAEIAAGRAEIGQVLTRDFLQSTDDAKQILNVAMEHRTAPPDARQVGEMRRQAWQQVQAKYGRGAAQVLADAKTMIARDPRVVQALSAFNLGDSPRIVLAACEAAVRARAQGKFPAQRRR